MSIDNALRAIAFAEAPTLGVGIALIAKHRGELDAALRAAELHAPPVVSEGAATERAVAKIAAASEPAHVLDKSA
jgi:hypothetical protein